MISLLTEIFYLIICCYFCTIWTRNLQETMRVCCLKMDPYEGLNIFFPILGLTELHAWLLVFSSYFHFDPWPQSVPNVHSERNPDTVICFVFPGVLDEGSFCRKIWLLFFISISLLLSPIAYLSLSLPLSVY